MKHPVKENTHMEYRGSEVSGTYSTQDGRGKVEYDHENKEWYAWRTDIPGVTAHFNKFDEAQHYAFYGQGEIEYYADGNYKGIRTYNK